jgi:hypothetical protein
LIQTVQKRVAELSVGARPWQPLTAQQQASDLDSCDVYMEIAVAEIRMVVKQLSETGK